MDSLGNRIKQVRQDKKLTQQSFADRISVSRPFISRIEANKETPSDSLIKLISLEFGISHDWLSFGIGAMFSDEGKIVDLGTASAVSDSIEGLLKQIGVDVKKCTDFEKKMTFDILGELKHLLSLTAEKSVQKTVSVETARNVFCYTTLFIDRCLNVRMLNAYEAKRIEDMCGDCITDCSGFLTECKNVFLCNTAE